MDPLLTSAEAAQRLGVGASTIKRWAESGLIACERTAGRHRRFRLGEVERLRATLRGQAGAQERAADPGVEVLLSPRLTPQVQAWLLAERARLGSWAALADQVAASLQRLGELWQSGAISVLAEHAASERLERALARCSDEFVGAAGGPRCLLTAVEGDQHTLGLALAEPVLREQGWSVEWGGALPTVDIERRLAQRDLDLVVTSASSTAMTSAGLERCAASLAASCAGEGVSLILAGSGPWPELRDAAVARVRSFGEFTGLLSRASMRGRRTEAP